MPYRRRFLGRTIDDCSVLDANRADLNGGIPIYRLEEARNATPAAQHLSTTSLKPWGIVACFGLKIWDDASQKVISTKQARAAV